VRVRGEERRGVLAGWLADFANSQTPKEDHFEIWECAIEKR
jgi:hypothetical protein